MALGDYSKRTFQNGVTTVNPTTFQPMEDKIKELDTAAFENKSVDLAWNKKEFYINNTKEIEDFTAASEFTKIGCVGADETFFDYLNDYGVRSTDSDNTAGWCNIYKANTISLSSFNNGQASSTSDFIALCFYIHDVSFVSGIEIRLGTNITNCYYKAISSGLISGRNVIYVKKSDFSTVGTAPAWSGITYTAYLWESTAGASDEYVVFCYCQLVRVDPVTSTFFSSVQSKTGSSAYTNNITNNSHKWLIVYEKVLGDISLVNFETSSAVNDLILNPSEFYSVNATFKLGIMINGKTSKITFYHDSNNYCNCYIDSNTLYMYSVVGGVSNNVSAALTTNLVRNDIVSINFVKTSAYCKVVFESLDNDITSIKTLTLNNAFSEALDICIGGESCHILDFNISGTENNRMIGNGSYS